MFEDINRRHEPNPAMASQFLTRFDEDGVFTFQTFDDCKMRKAPYLARILHGSFDEHRIELLRLNQQGAGIFFTVNATDGRGRSGINITKIRAVFVDLDGAPLDPIYHAPLEPHLIVQSSQGKYHAYWIVDRLPLDQFTNTQKFLAKQFQGDSKVCDLPRVMRLPGFYHHKSEPYLTHVIQENHRRPYCFEEFLAAFKVNLSEVSQKEPRLGVEHDPILKTLQARNMLRNSISNKPGGWEIVCPWASSHTTKDHGTHYFEAHTNGYKRAGFHCFHAHCKDKSVEHLKNWLSIDFPSVMNSEWAAPITLPKSLPDVAAFNENLLPNSLKGWIMDIAERMQIPPDFSAAALFVILGSLMGRKLGIYPKQKDNWIVVPNLWGAVIGRPSLLKSPAIAEVMKPLERLILASMEEHQMQQSYFEKQGMIADAQKAALKENLKRAAKKDNAKLEEMLNQHHESVLLKEPILKRYKTEDSTVEMLGQILLQNPEGILVHRDELTGWLTSLDRYGREGDRSFYLESWNGTGSFTVDRIGRGSLHIPALCLSILGGIQPGPISSYVYQATAGGAGDDGLLQRFQMTVWPDAPKTWKNIDRLPDNQAKSHAYEIFECLDRLVIDHHRLEEGEIPALRFSLEGQEIFNAWRTELELRLRKGDLLPALESHLAKYRSLMPSIALIFYTVEALSKGQPIASVSGEAASQAVAWCNYLETHAKRLYSSAKDPAMEAARALLDRIKKGDLQDGFAARDVYRKQWSHLNSSELVHQGTKILVDFGWVKEESIDQKGKLIRIHPSIKRK